MYVITDKNNVIICISPTLDRQSNGNPLVHNGSMAISASLVGAESGDIEVPEGVGEQTHIWIDGGFAENPNYTPPQPDYAELIAGYEEKLQTVATQLVDTQIALCDVYELILGGVV